MVVRAREPRSRWTHRRLIAAASLALGLGAVLAGCAEAPLPEQRLRADDCLRQLQLDRLPEAIRRCDAVVAAHPRDPAVRNERYLLHTLAGNEAAACADIRRARELLAGRPTAGSDPLLRQDVALRVADCPP